MTNVEAQSGKKLRWRSGEFIVYYVVIIFALYSVARSAYDFSQRTTKILIYPYTYMHSHQ